MADINNEKVIQQAENNRLLKDIREDVFKFTQSKEVQQMILADDLARMDWNSNMNYQRKEGRAEGKAEGKTEEMTEIIDLNKWLISEGRQDDILRYSEDPSLLPKLKEEFHSSTQSTSQE